MFCKKCGNIINDGEHFCSVCGEPVSLPESNEAQAERSVSDTQTNTPESTNPIIGDSQAGIDCKVPKQENHCGNCGSEILEDEIFCSVCGTRVKKTEEPDYSFASSAPSTKSKKFNPAIMISVAIILLAAGIVVKAYPYIKNGTAKMFLSSDKYFSYVVKNNFNDIADTVSSDIDIAKDSISGDSSAEGEITLELGEDAISTINDIAYDYTYMDIEEYIDWLKSVSISYKATTDENAAGVDLGVTLNDVDIAELNAVIDMDNMDAYYGLPNYNPAYLYTQLAPYDSSAYDEVTDSINQVLEALPSKKATKKLILRYVECIAKSVEDVEESKETIEANDISQKVTKLSVDIDGETILNAATNVLTEAREDDELIKMVEEISSAADADFDADDFEEAIDYALESVEDADPDEFDEKITFELYVNGKGEIAGMNLLSEYFEFTSLTAQKGNKFGSLTEFSAEGMKVTFEGSGKISGNNRSGEYELKVMGMPVIDCQVDNLDTKKLQDGVFNGSVTISLSDGITEMASEYLESELGTDYLPFNPEDISLTISSNSKSMDNAECEFIINYEEEMFAKLAFTNKTKGSKKVSIPSDYVDINDYDASEEWLADLDIDSLFDKLRDAGVPEEFIEELEENYPY